MLEKNTKFVIMCRVFYFFIKKLEFPEKAQFSYFIQARYFFSNQSWSHISKRKLLPRENKLDLKKMKLSKFRSKQFCLCQKKFPFSLE